MYTIIINDITYSVDYINNNYYVYKIENNIKTNATVDEIKMVITALKEDLNKKETLKKTINQKIDNKEYKNVEELIAYLDTIDLSSEEKQNIINYYKEKNELTKDILETSECEKYYTKIKEYIKKERPESEGLIIDFDVNGGGLCKVNVSVHDFSTGQIKPLINDKLFYYNEEFKNTLLAPVIKESALHDEVVSSEVIMNNSLFDNNANYRLFNKSNVLLNVKDIDKGYADIIKAEVDKTKPMEKDDKQVQGESNELSNNQEQENSQNNQLTNEEQKALNEELGYTRVLRKNDEGNVSTIVIYSLVVILFIFLVVITTYIMIK